MEERFKLLLERYLTNTSTEAEEDEFFTLIHAGPSANVESLVRQRIEKILLEDTGEGEDVSVERANEILKYVLSADKIEETHHAAAPSKTIFLKPWTIAAAASLLIGIAATVWVLTETAANKPKVYVATGNVVVAKPGPGTHKGKQYITLLDGSKVLLNEGSTLSYGANFGENVRDVQLTGEAYFDIAHDATRPFRVITGNVITKVLGTAFNVRTAPGGVEVTVTRGKVEVLNEKKTLGVITTDQQIAVNTTENTFKTTESPGVAEDATAWKSNYLIFDNVSMETAAAIIEEKYGMKILFANDDLKRCRITATFLHDEEIRQVIDVMSGVIQATTALQPDGNIRIDGRGCKND